MLLRLLFARLPFLCLLSIAVVGMALAVSESPPEKSLLSNGDFQQDSRNIGWPDGWSHPEGATLEKEGDQRFLRLTSSEPGQMVMVFRQMNLPSPPPSALEIRMKVRYADIKRGKNTWFDGRVIAHFKNAEGKVLKPEPAAASFKGTSKDWVEKKMLMKVPASARMLEILPSLFQVESGTLDIASIEVFPESEDLLPKPPPIIPSETLPVPHPELQPLELHVKGNKLETKDGKDVWLQGLCIDSLEWSAGGERIQQSIGVATEQWKANVIRLPVREHFWFGRGPWQKKGDGGVTYRKLVDAAIESANAHGAYVALDLHVFGAPLEKHVEFWKDAATRYKNHPGVIFELFNEPHSISWKVWRDGGSLKGPDNKDTDVGAKENNEENDGERCVGMQALLDTVRATGARNPIIAGGLDWGYDLSGVAGEFALHEHDGGDGIIYSSHVYPWKRDWQGKTLIAADKYPIFVGEVGCPPDWKSYSFIPVAAQTEDLSKPDWAIDMIGLIQKYHLNWTAFSFHPKTGPMLIQDWDYTPTPYWGAFVKEALAGKIFEMKKMR